MKTVISEAGAFGPFRIIEPFSTYLLCDGVKYQFDTIGKYTLIDGSPEPVPDPPPPVVPLDQLIARRRADSDALAAAKRDSVVAGTSPAEMASWPIKLAEAMKFTASSVPADAPYLAAEAEARGVTLDVLVAKVQTNGAVLAGLEAQIAGVNGKHRDAIAAMTDSAAVLAYDITAGYPV